MKTLMIYGATGYTGRMAARHAKAAGLKLILAGRSADRLAPLAAELELPFRIFSASHVAADALAGISVLLNFAGPFAHTAEPLMRACILAGVDYLDITAEINVYRLAESLDREAAQAGVMLMPGVGWDVVPTDCLALHVSARVEQPQSLNVALQVAGPMSRGSASSVSEIIGAGVLARVGGQLVATPDQPLREFDFGAGPKLCVPLSFGDLVTGWRSTGIPNIAMYAHIPDAAFSEGDISELPEGPSEEQRLAHRAFAVAEVVGADGSMARSVIETVNGYTYTPLAAVEAARRVLGGERRAGFETPAHLLGVGFAETIAGTAIKDF